MVEKILFFILYAVSRAIMLGLAAYIIIAFVMFEVNNPTANRMQLLLHIDDVFTFKTLEKFQGNKDD